MSDIGEAASKMFDELEVIARDPLRNPLLLWWYTFNQVFAELALPAIERLAEENHGTSGCMLEEGVDPLTATQEQWDSADKKWESILIEIRDVFSIIVERERNHEHWDVETQERVANGLQLFAKHFFSLWD